MGNALLKTGDLAERLPAPDEAQSAHELLALMQPFAERRHAAEVTVSHGGKSETFHLSPAVAQTLATVLRHFSAGKAVTIVPVGAMLTTQQAADILNVSRPYFIKLLDEGEISHEKVGRHRRVSSAELFAYKKRRDEIRRKALADMAAENFAAGEI